MQQSEPLENPRTQHNVYAISLIFPSSKYKNIKKKLPLLGTIKESKSTMFILFIFGHIIEQSLAFSLLKISKGGD